MNPAESFRMFRDAIHARTEHPADKVSLRRTSRADCPDCGPVDAHGNRCPFCTSECATPVQQRPRRRIRAPYYIAS